MKNKKRGFSLIELLITISILSIIMGLTIPQLLTPADQTIRQELNRITTIFFYLRQKALACNQSQTLFFDTQKNCYFYQTTNQRRIIHHLPTTITFGFLSGVKGPPSKADKLIEQALTFPYNQKIKLYSIIFSSDGIISPGTMYLVEQDKTMYALTCSPISTSYLRRYTYDKNNWKSYAT